MSTRPHGNATHLCGSLALRGRDQRRVSKDGCHRSSSVPTETGDVQLPGSTEPLSPIKVVLAEAKQVRKACRAELGDRDGLGLRAGLRRLRDANVQLQARVEGADSKADTLGEQVRTLQGEAQRLREELEASQKEAAALRSWAEGAKSEAALQKARAEAAEEEAMANRHWAESSKGMQAAIAQAVADVERRLKVSDEARAALEAQLAKQARDAAAEGALQRQRLEDAEAAAEAAEAGAESAGKFAAGLREELSQAQRALHEAESQAAALRRHRADLEEGLSQAQQEAERQGARAQEELLRAQRAESEIAALRQRLLELEDGLSRAERESERHRAEGEEGAARCAALQRELEDSRERARSLQAGLEEARGQAEELALQAAARAASSTRLEALVAEQRRALADAPSGSDVADLQLELKAARVQVSELELELTRERAGRDGDRLALDARAEGLSEQLLAQQRQLEEVPRLQEALFEAQRQRDAAEARADAESGLAAERHEAESRAATLEAMLHANSERTVSLSEQVAALQDALAAARERLGAETAVLVQSSGTARGAAEAAHASQVVLGLSVRHLGTTLLDRVRAAGLGRDASIYEVGLQVARRQGHAVRGAEHGDNGAAYIDGVEGEGHVGPASLILSCTSDSAIGEVVDALSLYCEEQSLRPDATYVWLHCLCAGEHGELRARRGAPAAQQLRDEVAARMTAVGKVLVLMSPWEAPRCCERTWCYLELYVAMSLGQGSCEVAPVMPRLQCERLAQELRAGGERIADAWRMLAGVGVEGLRSSPLQAEISFPQESTELQRLLEETPGCEAVGSAVSRRLRGWLAAAAEGQARRLLASGELAGELAARVCDLIGWQLREANMHRRAMGMLQDGLQLSVDAAAGQPGASGMLSVAGRAGFRSAEQQAEKRKLEDEIGAMNLRGSLRSSEAGATLLASLGAARWQMGDQHGAADAFQDAKRARVAAGALCTLDGAVLLRNIGIVEWSRGAHREALRAFAESKQICEQTGSLHSLGGAKLLLNIGFAKAEGGDSEGAHEAFQQALLLLGGPDSGSWRTPSGATLLTSIGVALGNQGDQQGALRAYRLARYIRERVGTLESAAGAVVLRNIGTALAASGDPAGAADAYLEARAIRERLGSLDTTAGAHLLAGLGAARAAVGDRAGALRLCAEARDVYLATGALGSPGGRSLMLQLERLERQA